MRTYLDKLIENLGVVKGIYFPFNCEKCTFVFNLMRHNSINK